MCIRDRWTRGALRALRVVLPGAGPRGGCRSAWLDYEGEGAAPTAASLRAAREQAVAVVRRELQRGRSVVVGGYSEGCLVGLEAALRTPGVLGFVGAIPLTPTTRRSITPRPPGRSPRSIAQTPRPSPSRARATDWPTTRGGSVSVVYLHPKVSTSSRSQRSAARGEETVRQGGFRTDT